MRVVSWNLNGLDATHLDVRTEAALFTVLLGGPPEEMLLGEPEPPPDVILLQEVVERSYHAAVRPHLMGAGYTLIPSVLPNRNYFEVVAFRGEPQRIVNERLVATEFERRLMGAQLSNGVWVYTAHMDSMAGGATARRAQMVALVERLSGQRAIFAGDTNLRDAEVPPLGTVEDAWEVTGRDPRARVTYIRGGKRYDRAYVSGLDVVGFRTFGGKRIGGVGVTASDHLAIEVTLRSDASHRE